MKPFCYRLNHSFTLHSTLIVLIICLLTPSFSIAQRTSWEKPVVAGHLINDYFLNEDGEQYSAGKNFLDEQAKYNDFSFPDLYNEISNYSTFIIKADSSHQVEWIENFYNSRWTFSPNITLDQENNMYVSFGFRGNIKVGSILLEVGPDEPRIVLMKLNSKRELVWMNYIKPTDPLNDDLINYKLKISPSGNIYLSGNCAGSYGFYDSNDNLIYLNTWEERTGFISKYTSDGQLIWAKTLPEGGNLNSTYIYDFDFDQFENVYFTGTHYWEGDFQGVVHMTPYPQIMVGSLSGEGNLNWIEFLGQPVYNNGPNVGYGIAVDDNLKAIYVTGTLRTKYENENNTDGKTAVLFRMDFAGNYVWHRRMGSSVGLASIGPKGTAVTIDKSGDPVVSGLSNSKGTFGDIQLHSGGIPYGVFVAKLNSFGEFLWADFAGSYYEDEVKGIKTHKPEELILYGNTHRGAIFGENKIGMDESVDVGFIAKLRYSDPEFLSVATNYFNIDNGEETDSLFEISSNVNWTITSDQDWLVPVKTEGSGNSLVSFSVKKNLDFLSRTGSMTVTGANGEIEKISIRQEKGFDLITGIEGKENEDFKVFPNPILSSYTIKLPRPANTLTLYNSDGRKVAELNPSSLNQEGLGLASGVYYLIAVFDNDVLVKKIIKL